MRGCRTGAVALLAMAAACNGGSTTAGAPSPTATPTPIVTPTTVVTTAPPVTPTPTASAAPQTATLAFVRNGTVHVVRVNQQGAQVGKQIDLGPIELADTLSWSPKGRYLAWRSTSAAGAGSLHIWDSKLSKESVTPLDEQVQEVRAGGTGARTVIDKVISTHDRNGKVISTQTLPANADEYAVSLAADPATLIEPSHGEGKAADLLLVSATGSTRVVGHVAPVSFLGSPIAPEIGSSALSTQGTLAVAAELGQDGGCAQKDQLHLISLSGGTDSPVVFPEVDGDSSTRPVQISYDPTGLLSGVFVQCADGGPVKSLFVDLVDGSWVTRGSGLSIATRGPFGLLARRAGGVKVTDYEPTPAGSLPLQVVTSSGTVTLSLGTAVAADWAP